MDNLGFRTVRPIAPVGDKTKETKETPAALSRVAVVAEGAVARVTLQHPPLNVIDIAMMDELSSSLTELESNPEISVVIVKGQRKRSPSEWMLRRILPTRLTRC